MNTIITATRTTTMTSFLSLRRRRERTLVSSSPKSSSSFIHSVANSRRRRHQQQREHLQTRSSSLPSSNNETITNTKGKILKWSDIDEKTKELPDTSVAKKMQITGVHHVAIIVKDMQRTMDFYQGILCLLYTSPSPRD